MKPIWQGEPKAWEAYFKEYYSLFLNFAYSLVKDEDVAIAVVSNVFIKLWEKRGSFETEADMKFKFISEIRYRSIDHFREIKKASEREVAAAGDVIETYNIPEAEHIDKYFESKRDKKLYEEIDLLPKKCRQIMILYIKEKMQVKDIAKKLNISHNTVSTQIKNGVEKLRSSLLEQLKRVKDNPSLSDIELLLIYTLLYVESALFSAF